VGSSDVILIRIGRWALRDAKGPWEASRKSAGLVGKRCRACHTRQQEQQQFPRPYAAGSSMMLLDA